LIYTFFNAIVGKTNLAPTQQCFLTEKVLNLLFTSWSTIRARISIKQQRSADVPAVYNHGILYRSWSIDSNEWCKTLHMGWN